MVVKFLYPGRKDVSHGVMTRIIRPGLFNIVDAVQRQYFAVAFLLLMLLHSRSTATIYPICINQVLGFTGCYTSNNTASFKGMDVNLIRWVASNRGWIELTGVLPFDTLTWTVAADNSYDSSSSSSQQLVSSPAASSSGIKYKNSSNTTSYFYFKCLESSNSGALVSTVIATGNVSGEVLNDTSCAIGAGSLTVTEQRILSGAIFSYPYYRTALGILIANDVETTTYNIWAFLQPFELTIWVALLCTLVLTPITIWAVENLVQTGSLPLSNHLGDWRHAVYTTGLTMFNLEVLPLLSAPSQLMIVCFCFLNLVIVSSYTANLAAALSNAVTQQAINSVSDLRGLPVAAHGIYVQRLSQNDYINAETLNWDGAQTFMEVTSLILSGSIAAYIVDLPILQTYDNFYDRNCALTFLNQQLEQFDFGFALSPILPPSAVSDINLGILAAQAADVPSKLASEFLSVSTSCSSTSSVPGTSRLSFIQVAGLWVILGCSSGIGLLWSLYSIFHFHVKGKNLISPSISTTAAALTPQLGEDDALTSGDEENRSSYKFDTMMTGSDSFFLQSGSGPHGKTSGDEFSADSLGFRQVCGGSPHNGEVSSAGQIPIDVRANDRRASQGLPRLPQRRRNNALEHENLAQLEARKKALLDGVLHSMRQYFEAEASSVGTFNQLSGASSAPPPLALMGNLASPFSTDATTAAVCKPTDATAPAIPSGSFRRRQFIRHRTSSGDKSQGSPGSSGKHASASGSEQYSGKFKASLYKAKSFMQALASKVFVKVNEDGEVEGQDPAAEAGEGEPKAFFRPLASAASKTHQGRRNNRRRASTLGNNAVKTQHGSTPQMPLLDVSHQRFLASGSIGHVSYNSNHSNSSVVLRQDLAHQEADNGDRLNSLPRPQTSTATLFLVTSAGTSSLQQDDAHDVAAAVDVVAKVVPSSSPQLPSLVMHRQLHIPMPTCDGAVGRLSDTGKDIVAPSNDDASVDSESVKAVEHDGINSTN